MDERINRFKHCDPRFHPYLDKVFSRLPADVREELLNDEGLQIIADAEAPDVCGKLFTFDRPVKTFVFLYPKALIQPEHRLLCGIAWELADHVARKEGKEDDERKRELLTAWGFEREVDAVCFCNAVAGSPPFKAGYAWAAKQSRDYLMRHFGLYFDEWNEKGLPKMPADMLKALRSKVTSSQVLSDAADTGEKDLPAGLSPHEVLIEGIMAAIREIKFQEDQGTVTRIH